MLTESAVEAQHEQRVHSKRLNGAQFLWQRVDERRHLVGRNDRARVLVESHHNGYTIMLSGIRDGLSDDLLVAEMHSIKDTYRQADLSPLGLQFSGNTNEFHEASVAVIRQSAALF